VKYIPFFALLKKNSSLESRIKRWVSFQEKEILKMSFLGVEN